MRNRPRRGLDGLVESTSSGGALLTSWIVTSGACLWCACAPAVNAHHGFRLGCLVQGQVEVQHVDGWFAEHAEGPTVQLLVDKVADLLVGEVVFPRHAGHLEVGVGRADGGV